MFKRRKRLDPIRNLEPITTWETDCLLELIKLEHIRSSHDRSQKDEPWITYRYKLEVLYTKLERLKKVHESWRS